jgi:hypothetical protein
VSEFAENGARRVRQNVRGTILEDVLVERVVVLELRVLHQVQEFQLLGPRSYTRSSLNVNTLISPSRIPFILGMLALILSLCSVS